MTNVKAWFTKSDIQHLDERQAHAVFMQVLDQLREEHFLRGSKLFQTIDMQGHGSDIDEEVRPGEYDELRFKRITQAIKLHELLSPLCFNFEPHRVTNSRCVDCGRPV